MFNSVATQFSWKSHFSEKETTVENSFYMYWLFHKKLHFAGNPTNLHLSCLFIKLVPLAPPNPPTLHLKSKGTLAYVCTQDTPQIVL